MELFWTQLRSNFWETRQNNNVATIDLNADSGLYFAVVCWPDGTTTATGEPFGDLDSAKLWVESILEA